MSESLGIVLCCLSCVPYCQDVEEKQLLTDEQDILSLHHLILEVTC